MTLTNLRRLVLFGSVLSLGAAGAAAWFSLEAKASPRAAEEWPKLFPVRSGNVDKVGIKELPPLTEFIEASKWPQGDLPPAVDPNAKAPEAPKPDPFESRYKLNSVQEGERAEDSVAQLRATGVGDAFSIRVGCSIPQAPEDPAKHLLLTPWRLDAVDKGGPEKPATALFTNSETGETKTLSSLMANGKDITQGGAANLTDIAGARTSEAGVPEKGQPPRVIPIPGGTDAAKGIYEFAIPEEEAAWFDRWGDEEVSGISVEETKDPATGKPDGFRLKAVPAGSHAYAMGLRTEDKIISVNQETVTSTADALSKGRRQYDQGASTFQIKGIRAGKEVNFTFHAPRRKNDGKK